MTVRATWYRFWQEFGMAQHHGVGPTPLGPSPRNPFLDGLLATHLYVSLVAILDEGLEKAREARDLAFPPRSRKDLHARIELLRDDLSNADALHEVRDRRNELSHTAGDYSD